MKTFLVFATLMGLLSCGGGTGTTQSLAANNSNQALSDRFKECSKRLGLPDGGSGTPGTGTTSSNCNDSDLKELNATLECVVKGCEGAKDLVEFATASAKCPQPKISDACAGK